MVGMTSKYNTHLNQGGWLRTIMCILLYHFNSPFTLRGGTVTEEFRNGSYCSVNRHGTVLKRTISCGTVPPRVGGPNQFRTVPFTSENNT